MPKSPVRRRFFALAESETFEFGTLIVILLNVCMMATESYNAEDSYIASLFAINWVFTTIFTFELVVRLIAYGASFFNEAWNIFDMFVVLISIIEQLFAASLGIKVLRVLRIARIFRTIRIVRRVQRLHSTMQALASALPALLSAIALVLLVTFIITMIGVQFFAGLKHGRLIDQHRNFDNSWTCMTLLFQVATGSGYRLALGDASVTWPACTKCEKCKLNRLGEWDDFNDCGNWQGASAYLGVYLFLVRYILLNLLVAILVDKFVDYHAQMRFVLQDKHLLIYQRAWHSLDEHSDNTLAISQLRVLVELLHRLKNPLGSCLFADEYKYRLARVELIHNCPHFALLEGRELDFNQTLLTLALHVAGPHALPLEKRLKREQHLTLLSQMAVTSRFVQLFNQTRQTATLEEERKNSLLKLARFQNAEGAITSEGTSGDNIIFPVFNGASKIVIDMNLELLLHVDDSPTPVILFQMPFNAIAGVTDEATADVIVTFFDGRKLVVEIDEGGEHRVQLVDVLRSFQDINNSAQEQQVEENRGPVVNKKNEQSDLLKFRVVASKAMMEVERSIHNLGLKRRRDGKTKQH